MKKRIRTCLLALLAVLTMMVPAWAEQTEDDLFIYDTVGLLDEDEWLELEMMADEHSAASRPAFAGRTLCDRVPLHHDGQGCPQ